MNSQVDYLLHQAIQCLQSTNLDMAQQHLEQAIGLEPNHPDAFRFLGIIAAQRKQYAEALNYLNASLISAPGNFLVFSNIGNVYSELKEYDKALDAYEQSLKIEPRYEEAWANKANALYELGRYDEALLNYDQALILRPDFAQAMYSKGNTLFALSRFDEAIESCDKALSLIPDFVQGWFIVGDRLNTLGRFDEAITHYDRALNLVPDNAELWINKGVALQALKRFDEALVHYNRAIGLAPDYAQAYSNKGNTLYDLSSLEESVVHHQKAIAIKPDYVEAWYNLGIALAGLKRFDEAIAHYDKAISLRQDCIEAWLIKGVTLQSIKRLDEALDHYDKLLKLKPDYAEAWSSKGATLHELERYDEAIAHYDKAITLKPNICWIRGDLMYTAARICDWSNFERHLENITTRVSMLERAINPFSLLAFIDNSFLHRHSSRTYVQSKYLLNNALGPIAKRSENQKIRVGYYSADFRDHPVSFLTAELFELHDKNKFEIFAFSFVGYDDSPMCSRLKQAFNQFIDVSNMSDLEVAKLSRELEIDIAVDLGGYTHNSRTGIFAYRAAPIQINYLGYPGTMGSDYIDYIIADQTLIPQDSQQFYSEKIVYLPNTYQVNDRKRVISDKQFTRQELGLPEKGFVFCCFNNSYKVLPEIFAAWMRILKAVEGSVLWLFEDNPRSVENLKKETSRHEIDTNRLVFAKRMSLPDHLARHSQADLFLDTWPYNAHTTASDALWAGLPILTLMGQSFASRVAASLLNAIGLPELITGTQEEYEALAIELAKNPQKLRAIKLKLANNRLTAPLFDTPLFTKNLEVAYTNMYEEYRASL